MRHLPYVHPTPYKHPTEPSKLSMPEPQITDRRERSPNILHRLAADPSCTFYFEVDSEEIEILGIRKGMLLVVDCSRRPEGGMLVLARHNEDWLVRQLISHGNRQYLSTGRENDEIIEVGGTAGPLICGVVTWACLPMTEQGEFNEL